MLEESHKKKRVRDNHDLEMNDDEEEEDMEGMDDMDDMEDMEGEEEEVDADEEPKQKRVK